MYEKRCKDDAGVVVLNRSVGDNDIDSDIPNRHRKGHDR